MKTVLALREALAQLKLALATGEHNEVLLDCDHHFACAPTLLPIATYADSLCTSGETTFFSCQIKDSKKTVSLCGNVVVADSSNEQFNDDAWLQYRFGTP